MSEFNQTKYIQKYNKEHYIRKEIAFKKEDWEKQIEPKLKKDNTSIKQIVLDYVNGTLKKEEKDN